MAEVNAPDQTELTDAEVDRKIAKLVRSPDPNVSMKAAELYDKRKQRAKEQGTLPEDDGQRDVRLTRDFLEMENGASQFMLWCRAVAGDMGWPGNYALLHDVWYLAQREPFGQQIFDWCGRNCSEESRKDLEKKLANPSYQQEQRIAIWKEINKRPPAPIDNVVSLRPVTP